MKTQRMKKHWHVGCLHCVSQEALPSLWLHQSACRKRPGQLLLRELVSVGAVSSHSLTYLTPTQPFSQPLHWRLFSGASNETAPQGARVRICSYLCNSKPPPHGQQLAFFFLVVCVVNRQNHSNSHSLEMNWLLSGILKTEQQLGPEWFRMLCSTLCSSICSYRKGRACKTRKSGTRTPGLWDSWPGLMEVWAVGWLWWAVARLFSSAETWLLANRHVSMLGFPFTAELVQ